MATDFELLKAYELGLTDEEVAAKLGISVEEASDRAFRMGITTGPSRMFSEMLRDWQAEGFVEQGWAVRYDRSMSCYMVKFQIGKHLYDITESQMSWFVIGAQHMAKFKEGEG